MKKGAHGVLSVPMALRFGELDVIIEILIATKLTIRMTA
mgnify:CR=1 FL=1|tara:strand:- start:549 stop:665 length:117 start_codon:yes stop_codon:yes gene_type:complete